MSVKDYVEKFLLRPPQVLIIDADGNVESFIKDALSGYDYVSTRCLTCNDAVEQLRSMKFDLVFINFRRAAVDTVQVLKSVSPDVPVVLVADTIDYSAVDTACRYGVVTFLKAATSFARNSVQSVFRLFNVRILPITAESPDFEHACAERAA